MAKGEKIDGWFWVARTGTRLIGSMAWETPYIYFHADNVANILIWHSAAADTARDCLDVGQRVKLNAFRYGTHLRRVTLTTEDGAVYGMEAAKPHNQIKEIAL